MEAKELGCLNGSPRHRLCWDVFKALEQELGGADRLTHWKRYNLRATKGAVTKADAQVLIPQIRQNLINAKGNDALKKSPLTQAQADRVDAYIQKTLFEDKKFLFGSEYLKLIDDTKEARKALDKPSQLRWLADRIQTNKTFVQGSLLDVLKTNARFNAAVNKIKHPSVGRGTLEFLRDLIGDKDPFLKEAFDHSLGAAAQDADHIALSEIAKSGEAAVARLAESIKARRAAVGQKTAEEAAALAEDEKKLRSAQAVLKSLKIGSNGAVKAAGAVKDAVEAAKGAGIIGKLIRGGSSVGKLALDFIPVFDIFSICSQVVLGGVSTMINRRLAARQALKILPLQSCHKEWTAGINGHLGAGFVCVHLIGGFKPGTASKECTVTLTLPPGFWKKMVG